MRLYFLRHADALDGMDDAARPLSDLGRKQSKELAQFLKHSGIAFDAAWTSPLVRACQTAEIVSKICHASSGRKLEITDQLLNETAQMDFDAWLKKLPEAKHALFVGHAPSLPERVRRLLGVSRPEALSLPKAGLVCLKTEDRRTAALKFFLTPKLLGI